MTFNQNAAYSRCERVLGNKEARPKVPTYSFRGQDTKPPSLITTDPFSSQRVEKVYTGDKMIGIGTMHKSNGVPIFSEENAKEISSMRR